LKKDKGLKRFSDKGVVQYYDELNHDAIEANCDTILPESEHYISILWPICCVSLMNLMGTKGGNL